MTTPASYTDLVHDNFMLLTALWRQSWIRVYRPDGVMCMICDATGPDKAAVVHAAGCALANQPRDVLAQLDGFEIAAESVV